MRSAGADGLSFNGAKWRTSDFGNVSSDVTLAGQTATFTVEAPDVALTGRGSVGLDTAGALAVSATWEPADVASVAKRMAIDVPMTGAVSLGLEWNATRDHVEKGNGRLSVNRADLTIADQKVSLAQPGRIDTDGTVIRVSPIVLATGSSRLTIDGALGDAQAQDRLALTLDGALADFGFVRDLVQPRAEGAPAPPPLAGSIHAELIAAGTVAAPRLSGALQIRGGSLPITDQAQVTDVEAGARYDGGVLVVDRMTAAFEGASLAATARVPSEVFIDRLPESMRKWIVTASGPGTLSAQVRSITPSVVAPFVDPATLEQIALHSDATIDLEADRPDLDRLRGAIVLTRAELSLGGVAFDQQTTTRVAIGNGRATIDSWNWGRGDNRVALRGGVALAADPVLDVTANAALDLRLLNAFAPAARTAGRADAEIRLSGTAQAPALDGYLTVSDGETRVADPRLVVGDMTGTVTLAGDLLTLESRLRDRQRRRRRDDRIDPAPVAGAARRHDYAHGEGLGARRGRPASGGGRGDHVDARREQLHGWRHRDAGAQRVSRATLRGRQPSRRSQTVVDADSSPRRGGAVAARPHAARRAARHR